MKKLLVLAAVLGLVVGSVATAEAAKKPQQIEFFFHGTEPLGEIDLINNVGTYNQMDTTAPTEPAPKTIGGFVWKEHFNDCAGSAFVPVWMGYVTGRIKGDMTITLHNVSLPRQLEVEVWPDVLSQTCASNQLSEGVYPEPAATKTVDVPPGHSALEIVLEDVDFKAKGSMIVQFTPMGGPSTTRILYDAADFASSIKFSCIPSSGSKCT